MDPGARLLSLLERKFRRRRHIHHDHRPFLAVSLFATAPLCLINGSSETVYCSTAKEKPSAPRLVDMEEGDKTRADSDEPEQIIDLLIYLYIVFSVSHVTF